MGYDMINSNFLKTKLISALFLISYFIFYGCSNAGDNSNTSLLALLAGGSGVTKWVKSVTVGPGLSEFNSVSVGSNGIYATGYIEGNSSAYDFGNGETVT